MTVTLAQPPVLGVDVEGARAGVCPTWRKWLVVRTETSGALSVAGRDAGVFNGARQKHERRRLMAWPAQPGKNSAIMRIQPIAVRMTGLHRLMPDLMNGCSAMCHRPHESISVGHRRHEWQMLADLDTGNIRSNGPERAANGFGRVRLRVPGIEVARTADEEQDNAIPIRSAVMACSRPRSRRSR